ncbi:Lrp/AsnC family transcriptional regulator [Candidatus Pacearchaeota archaeon]|nr:Lrp/AsnC family transcriptional regulator [Candidatus Pacearchaeota archaeon]
MEFDVRDRQIIEAIYHNWRASTSKLSRDLRMSRRKIEYRIQNYFSSGIIRTIFSVFNYSTLGFNCPAYIFIRLSRKKDFEMVGKFLTESKRCTSFGKALTEYDLFSNFIFQDRKEMKEFVKKFQNYFGKSLAEVLLIEPKYAEFYPLKIAGSSLRDPYLLTLKDKKVSLDDLDLKIIKELGKNSRKSIVEIAENSKILPETCLYRIKELVRKKVILGSRVQFDLRKAGYFATCLFVNATMSNDLTLKLGKFCRTSTNANYLIISKKDPQVIIQVFHRDEETLSKLLGELSLLLGDNLGKITLVKLEDDIDVINPVPFI